MRILGGIILLLSLPLFAQYQLPANPPPEDCTIVHVSSQPNEWDVYVHGEEKAHWIASRSDLMKAAKDCKNYLKEQDESKNTNKKTKSKK